MGPPHHGPQFNLPPALSASTSNLPILSALQNGRLKQTPNSYSTQSLSNTTSPSPSSANSRSNCCSVADTCAGIDGVGRPGFSDLLCTASQVFNSAERCACSVQWLGGTGAWRRAWEVAGLSSSKSVARRRRDGRIWVLAVVLVRERAGRSAAGALAVDERLVIGLQRRGVGAVVVVTWRAAAVDVAARIIGGLDAAGLIAGVCPRSGIVEYVGVAE
ncbi:hypothetical protein LTR29_006079 [Friedmanniomyces endolithicus]|nr:hypothetical protein LTR29_006079 [Friedmanniomyces endolithicus]